MPSRSMTTSKTIFSRPNVTFAFKSPPGSSPITTITLPAHSNWSSELHWHEKHTEYLQVVSGTAWLSLKGRSQLVRASDGVLTVKPFERHEWRRPTPAELDDESQSDDLVMQEWTEPADGEKEVFFRNLNSVLIEPGMQGNLGWLAKLWLTLQFWVIFAEADNYPVFKIDVWTVERWATHVVLWMAVVVGGLFGIRGSYDEYTPKDLRRKMK